MKTLIAVVALSVSAGAAFAGEGNGDPFPFRAAPLSVTLNNYHQAKGKNQDPFPFKAPSMPMVQNEVLPTNGAAGIVQTANSLPPGFENGAAQPTLGRDAPAPTMLAQQQAAFR